MHITVLHHCFHQGPAAVNSHSSPPYTLHMQKYIRDHVLTYVSLHVTSNFTITLDDHQQCLGCWRYVCQLNDEYIEKMEKYPLDSLEFEP